MWISDWQSGLLVRSPRYTKNIGNNGESFISHPILFLSPWLLSKCRYSVANVLFNAHKVVQTSRYSLISSKVFLYKQAHYIYHWSECAHAKYSCGPSCVKAVSSFLVSTRHWVSTKVSVVSGFSPRIGSCLVRIVFDMTNVSNRISPIGADHYDAICTVMFRILK